MLDFKRLLQIKWLVPALALAAVVLGVALRTHNLPQSGLFFYDEGFYLNHNLPVLEFVEKHQLTTASDRGKALEMYFTAAMGSGKSLWFLIMDSRFLWGGLRDWAWPKVAACGLGILVLPLVFFFSRRYSGSVKTAWLATALYAVLPGAVFYSRIGLQEALSALLFLSGLYLYLPNPAGSKWWRIILAGVAFAAAFFSNYRLIMIPGIIVFIELWNTLLVRERFNWRKPVYCLLAFFACVVLVGNLFDAANTRVIAMWVFYQGKSAGGEFTLLNLLSYPFYMFRLETVLFASMFFGGAVFCVRREWSKALPFALVIFQMFFFSFTEEKGARYIAVVLPLACLSAAMCYRKFWVSECDAIKRAMMVMLIAAMMLMAGKSAQLAMASSDHQKAVEFIVSQQPGVRWVSSQDQVQRLYVQPHDRVQPIPAQFEKLVGMHQKGFRYLVLDPQSYISFGSGHKFVPPLKDYLGFIESRATPIKVFPHMNQALLERFVCEHSENLANSVRFLSTDEGKAAASIRVYDLEPMVPAMVRIYEELKKR